MWVILLLICIVVGWTLYFMFEYSRETDSGRKTVDAAISPSSATTSRAVIRMKRERLRLNQKYATSIKCKYCEHFKASGVCDVFSEGTSPDDACEHFNLPLISFMGHAFEAAEGREFTRRPDGTYIVDLHDASK